MSREFVSTSHFASEPSYKMIPGEYFEKQNIYSHPSAVHPLWTDKIMGGSSIRCCLIKLSEDQPTHDVQSSERRYDYSLSSPSPGCYRVAKSIWCTVLIYRSLAIRVCNHTWGGEPSREDACVLHRPPQSVPPKKLLISLFSTKWEQTMPPSRRSLKPLNSNSPSLPPT